MRAHRHQPAATQTGLECAICKANGEAMLAAERASVELLTMSLRGILADVQVSAAHFERAEHALRVAAGKVRR